MQRYFALLDNDNIVLNKNDIFHICKVMRNNVGDYFEAVKNEKIYLCKITSINPFSFIVEKEFKEDREINGYIRLLYCLPKGDKLDLVIQKSVELGVSEIVLINSSRCVKKFNQDEFNKKKERFNKIIKEASEQCRRSKLMKLDTLINFNDIKNYKDDENFICYENAKFTENELIEKFKSIKNKTINVLVGAEGGFSLDEVEYANKNNFESISLGKRILRSETSCLYIVSLLSFFMEN